MPSFEESLKLLQSSRMPTEATPDDKLKEMEDRLNADDSTDSLIAAAIPAVAGALTGFGEEGLKYGAQAGMEREKDKSTLSNKLLELRNKRLTKQGNAGSYKALNIEDEAGNIKVGLLNTTTGDIQDTGKTAGYSIQRIINPDSKMLEEASRSRPGSRRFEGAQPTDTGTDKNTIRNQEIVGKTFDAVKKDPIYAKSRDQVLAAKQIGTLIQKGGQISPKAISSSLTLLFEGNQRMTDNDTTRYGLPREFGERFNELLELEFSGKNTQPFRKELQEMTNVIAQRASKAGKETVDSRLKGLKDQYGIDASDRASSLYTPFQGGYSPQAEVDEAQNSPLINYPEVIQREYPPGTGQMKSFEKTSKGWRLLD